MCSIECVPSFIQRGIELKSKRVTERVVQSILDLKSLSYHYREVYRN